MAEGAQAIHTDFNNGIHSALQVGCQFANAKEKNH